MSTFLLYNNPNKQPSSTIEILDSQPATSMPIVFLGRGTRSPYGDLFQSSMFKLLDNGATDERPLPMFAGQFWYDLGNNVLKVSTITQEYQAETTSTLETLEVREWRTIGSPIYSSTPPSFSDVWYDLVNQQLKIFNGTTWVSVADRYLLLTGGTITGSLVFNGTVDVTNLTTDGFVNNASVTVTSSDSIQLQMSQGSTMESNFGSVTFHQTTSGELHTTYSKLTSQSGMSIDINSSGIVSPRGGVYFSIAGNNIVEYINGVLTLNRNVVLNNSKVTDVAFPGSSTDAARYDEFNAILSQYEDDRVNVNGDVMTGTLIVQASVEIADLMSTGASQQRGVFSFVNTNTASIVDTDDQLIISSDASPSAQFGISRDPSSAVKLNEDGTRSIVRNVSAPVGTNDVVRKIDVDTVEAAHIATISGTYDTNRIAKSWVRFRTGGFAGAPPLTVISSYNCTVVQQGGYQSFQLIHNSDSIYPAPALVSEVCSIVGAQRGDLEERAWNISNFLTTNINLVGSIKDGDTIRQFYGTQSRRGVGTSGLLGTAGNSFETLNGFVTAISNTMVIRDIEIITYW